MHFRVPVRRIATLALASLMALVLGLGAGADAPPDRPSDTRTDGQRLTPISQPALQEVTLSDYDCSAQSEIPQSECEALVALYSSTGGDTWWVNMGWLGEGPPSTWYGVTVLGGHVIELYLPVNNLSGSLPNDLGNLTELTALELDTNGLTGGIPAALGACTKLTTLNLSYNSLSGTIPSELGNLTLLEELHLASNSLSGSIPLELGNMASLHNLVLKGNDFTGGIPATLTGLSDLFYIDLSENALSGAIPSQLWGNPTLAWVVLDGNALTGTIPPGLGTLSGLVTLDLADNSLTGAIPADLSSATALLYVDLNDNGLTGGISEGLSALTLLTYLDLSGNPLAGSIPASLGNLGALERLDLSAASLTGAISESLGGLLYVQTMDLSGNSLTGGVPAALGGLASVELLDLSDNALTGSIPGGLAGATTLQTLDLARNQLEGAIPAELGALSVLQSLDLSGNELTGEPPAIWGGLGHLEALYLNDNLLDGAFPASLSAATGLEHLSLANNAFTGDIPVAIGNLTSLVDLSLGGNRLTGVLPSQIGSLSRLQTLVVRSNALTGPIPQSVALLTGLSSADLAYNLLATTDTGVDAFLASKDPDWSATQTVPPTDLRVTSVDMDRLVVQWTPIAYTGNLGHYELLLSQAPGGPYVSAQTSANKLTSAMTVAGLDANTTYYLVMRTVTLVHDDQANELVSGYTSEVAATTSVPTGFDCENVTEVPCAECDALEALYTSTDGANWQRSANWLQTNTISEWEGVTVSGGHVTGLTLASNNVVGALPPDVGDLSGLESLSIDHNALSGGIPAQLGNLSGLIELNLAANDLSGAIPAELGNLTALQWLQLHQNQLSGQLPAELGNLTSLTLLDVSENQLSGAIPGEMGSMSALQRLALHANSLSGNLPADFGNLSNLMALSVNDNALSGDLPAELTNLAALGSQWWATVDFGYNRLSATDAGLIAFLDEKDPNWRETQTVAPTDLAVDQAYSGSIRLSWTPIPYVGDDGWYQVSIAEDPGGPWTVHGATLSKAQGSYLADGLDSASRYWFQLRTTTEPHDVQANTLWSESTESVMGETDDPASEGLTAPEPWIRQYGARTGWPEQNTTPRLLADANGDGRRDIIALGGRVCYVSLSTGEGLGVPEPWLYGLGADTGWPEQDRYPRLAGDVNGDGMADLVAFGGQGVVVALSTGTRFGLAGTWVEAYGIDDEAWSTQNVTPRMLGDVNGDGMADIVAMGNLGTYVSLSTGDAFDEPALWSAAYGVENGDWTEQNVYPRMLGDVNDDGMQDVVGFGAEAVWVALSEGDQFAAPTVWIRGYGTVAGGWSEQDTHPRMLGDVNGDGRDDIVACGESGTVVSLSTGTRFDAPVAVVGDYGTIAGGWSSQNVQPRMLGDVNGDGSDDMVGLGDDGVRVALADW